MPYADPEKKRASDLLYKSARRAKLAAQERARIARLKAADQAAWRQKVVARSRKAHAKRKDDPQYKESAVARARKHWQKIKDDPAVKQKNVDRAKAWYAVNSDRAKATSKRARRISMQTDLQYKLGVSLRRRMYMAIKRKHHGSSAVRDLGCSIADLISHLERQFSLGMTWNNWGLTGWHIDHIRPLRSFDLTDPEQYVQACHYTNLQPLWAAENIGKGARTWRPGMPHPEAWSGVYDQALAAIKP